MKYFITGFGPFGNISENPSQVIASKAASTLYESGFDICYELLEVSTVSVDDFHNRVNDSDTFVIHIGVNASLNTMVLESQAQNIMNFRIPDARGLAPMNVPITHDLPPSENVENPLDVRSLVTSLSDQFKLSCNAGSYICNYAYFRALQNVGKKIKGCLFVHIPVFKRINIEQQVSNITSLIRELELKFT